MTWPRRAGSPDTTPTGMPRSISTERRFACAIDRVDSTAPRMTAVRSTGSRSSRMRPSAMRERSSSVSTWRACRSVACSSPSSARATTAGSPACSRSTWVQSRIVFSGLRSLWASVRTSSSLSRLVRSAAIRASRSRFNSARRYRDSSGSACGSMSECLAIGVPRRCRVAVSWHFSCCRHPYGRSDRFRANTICFGLVSAPVRLYPAASSRRIVAR